MLQRGLNIKYLNYPTNIKWMNNMSIKEEIQSAKNENNETKKKKATWGLNHCEGGDEGPSLGGDDEEEEPKSRYGYTPWPGGFSCGWIDSSWLESPTTSAHP